MKAERIRAVLVAVLAVVALLVPQPAAAKPEAILGVWYFMGGTIEVEKVDTNRYVGRVKDQFGSDCLHKRGVKFWAMKETEPNFYEGTQFGHREACEKTVEFDATWGVSGTFLTLCLTDPKNDESFCQDLQRAQYATRIFEWEIRVKAEPSEGQPDDPSYSTTTFNDFGKVIQEWSPDGWQLLNVTGGRFKIIDHYVPPAPNKATVVRFVDGSEHVQMGDKSKALGASLVVVESDYETCAPDSTGSLAMVDPKGDAPDEVTVNVCGVTVTFTHKAHQTDVVKVTFERKE